MSTLASVVTPPVSRPHWGGLAVSILLLAALTVAPAPGQTTNPQVAPAPAAKFAPDSAKKVQAEVRDDELWSQQIEAFAQHPPAGLSSSPEELETVRAALIQVVDNAKKMAPLPGWGVGNAHRCLKATIQKVRRAQANPVGAIQRERLDAPIGNFGDVAYTDPSGKVVVPPGRLYRGNQPTLQGLEWLYKQGVRTVVDLRPASEGTNYSDFTRAQYEQKIHDLGMTLVAIPYADGTCPPTDAATGRSADEDTFLQTMDDAVAKNKGAVYVHCSNGVGRTGTQAALYLKQQGVPMDFITGYCERFGMVPEPGGGSHKSQLDYIQKFDFDPYPHEDLVVTH
jgi:protein tyrosine phosphatase (PTP) superfamily phosphohydrolase (DUF442 family)